MERRNQGAEFTSRPKPLKKQLQKIDHRIWLGHGTPVTQALRMTWVDQTMQEVSHQTSAEEKDRSNEVREGNPSSSWLEAWLPKREDEMSVQPKLQIDRRDQVDAVDLWGPFTTDLEWVIAPTASGLAFLPLYQDGGWSGWVSLENDGVWEALKLSKANGVGMAMEIPEGADRLVLNYQTPGLKVGVLISLLGAASLLYWVYLVCRKQRSQVIEVDDR
jgi:hypothetical protein